MPEVCVSFHPLKSRGRREDRVRAAPAVSRAYGNKKRTRAYRFSGGNPAFPAQWFYGLYNALSPVTGLSCHRRLADTSARLDASVGASGPRDFAVRVSHVRLPSWPDLSRPSTPFLRETARTWMPGTRPGMTKWSPTLTPAPGYAKASPGLAGAGRANGTGLNVRAIRNAPNPMIQEPM